MQRDLVINDRVSIPRSELQFTFARSGGPGGQNVNKLNTKAVLRWRPADSANLPPAIRDRLLMAIENRLTRDGDLVIASDRFRVQGQNVSDCLQRLHGIVATAIKPPKKRRPTRPTRGSNERRLQAKRANAQKKARRSKRPDE